jgi:hypothetical protein
LVEDNYGGQHYARGFQHEDFDNLLDLAEVITRDVWSPIVWKDGRRRKAEFLGSDFWSLDFDEGTSVESMAQWARSRGLAHIIGLTKSHQREKVSSSGVVKPPCDRFRLIIPFHATIADLDTFEFNMREAIAKFRCDESCTDGARFYFPCVSVYAMHPGQPLAWKPLPDDQLTHEEIEEIHRARNEAMARRGVIPKWARHALRHGVGHGGRHKACYRLGANLIYYGFSAEQIIALIMESPLSEIGVEDVQRAVRNGIDRTKGSEKR